MKINIKKSIGIDISDRSIEIIELYSKEKKIKIGNFSRIVLSSGIVEGGRIKQAKELREALLSAFKRAKPKSIKCKVATVSLPDSQVYTRTFFVNSASEAGIKNIVESEVRASVPIIASDLLFSYKVFHFERQRVGISQKSLVVLTAISKTVATEWQDFFTGAGIEVEFFEIEGMAIYRGLYENNPDYPLLVADIGQNTANIAVFTFGCLIHTHVIPMGGNYLDKKIAEKMHIDISSAEKLKKEQGFIGDQVISKVLKESLRDFFKEIKEIIDYLQEERNITIKEINYVGGTSRLPGLIDYVSSLGLARSKLGAPLYGRIFDSSYYYIQAIGLARRGLNSKYFSIDPHISIAPQTKNKKYKLYYHNLIRKRRRISIIILGILLIFFVYLGNKFFSKTDSFFTAEKSSVELEKNQQKINIKFAIDVSKKIDNPQIIPGRIIETRVEKAMFYDEAEKEAKNKAGFELLEEENIIGRPVSNIKKGEALVFPLNFKWLVYNRNVLNKIIQQEIKKQYNINFDINKIEINDIDYNENDNIYFVLGKISISSKRKIDIDHLDIRSEVNKIFNKIKIVGAGPGLNVRKGPGTVYDKIGKVFNGEKYFVEEKTDSWIKIKYQENKSGWIYSSYTQEVKK